MICSPVAEGHAGTVTDVAWAPDEGRVASAGHDEAVHAVVICDDRDLTLNDIRAFFTRQRVAAYKWPDKLSHVERFPLTPIGKVDKRQLATILRESVT